MTRQADCRRTGYPLPDPMFYWNRVAIDASRAVQCAGEQPASGSRALAAVHLAMYDAYIGITNAIGETALPLYTSGLPSPPPWASARAAVAAAAHATLAALFPNQKPTIDGKYAEVDLPGPGELAGRHFGLAVARAVLADVALRSGIRDRSLGTPAAAARPTFQPPGPGLAAEG